MNKNSIFAKSFAPDLPDLDEATEPVGMRAAIERYARHSALVRNVLTVGDINNLTPEDRYSMLAYYALQQLAKLQRNQIEFLANMPPAPILVCKCSIGTLDPALLPAESERGQ
jgi:hypothetical protein